MSAKTLKVQQQQQQMDRAGAGIKSKMIKADAFDSSFKRNLKVPKVLPTLHRKMKSCAMSIR